MASLSLDLHLLGQTCLFFVAFVLGLVVVVPMAVAQSDFGGCPLSASFDWHSSWYFTVTPGSRISCNFVIYSVVSCCVLYGIIMGIYYAHSTHNSWSQPKRGQEMWCMPFLLCNALAGFFTFAAACTISVGFKQLCDGYVHGRELKKCVDIQRVHLKGITTDLKYDTRKVHSYLTTTEIACWVVFLVWLLQLSLSILRFVRNRRAESQLSVSSDTTQIAKETPTA